MGRKRAFTPAAGDPLRAEHQAVGTWIADALASLGEHNAWQDVDLKSLPSGKLFLDAPPEQACRYVRAALRQVRHFGTSARSEGLKAQAVAAALLKRALPFTKDDLLDMLECASAIQGWSAYILPLSGIARALERYAGTHSIDPALRRAMRGFGVQLRDVYAKDAKRLATLIEQLCVETADGAQPEAPLEIGPPPAPAPAGCPAVLDQLKKHLGLGGDAPEGAITPVGPDGFGLREDSPLRHEHERLGALLREAGSASGYQVQLSGRKAQPILALEPLAVGRLLVAAAERHVAALFAGTGDIENATQWQSRYAAVSLVPALATVPAELPRDLLFDLLLYLAARTGWDHGALAGLQVRLFAQIEREIEAAPLTPGERYTLHLWRSSLMPGPPLGTPTEDVQRVTRWIGDGAVFYLAPGEAWTEALNADIGRLPGPVRRQWTEALRHWLTATSPRPSAKWMKTATAHIGGIGAAEVAAAFTRFMPLVSRGHTTRRLGGFVGDSRSGSDLMNDENATALRGMLWCVPLLPDAAALARVVTGVALSAYRKVPGVGPRAVKVGNGAVYALSQIGSTDAVGQLAMLKVRVRFGTAQKEIEKAFDAAAAALALPRDQIEEMGVPSYGLTDVGGLQEIIGGYRAELVVTGSDAEIRWSDAGGKRLKSVPSKVGKEHRDELRELQQALKDVQSMLPAQRDRIDALFLAEKSWPYAVWRERYLEHPLVGTIARRLVWRIGDRPSTFSDGRAADVEGREVACPADASVRLWHPVGAAVEEITAWRRRLRDLGVTQPFKQAHREIYLLTDAERRTGTYSNRFAAHVLRQHQFNALCAARGWKNRLRLMVDDTYPPATRELPPWGLRAEFWIEGIGSDYGVDTNDAGAYLRLASDQVRFYRSAAAPSSAHAGGGGYRSHAAGPGRDDVNEPIALADVPPLVFSEIMRDVDLFVGVASVGNDPGWEDGGPGGRYREYWHTYAFGELSATATTRREALQQLVPLLKIADRCSFLERFLVVRGDKRTYKIHLGSGNILMEPNDQYLCIVPDAQSRRGESPLALPFEGDSVLSIVLSKALLLADDKKIRDPTILRQIG